MSQSYSSKNKNFKEEYLTPFTGQIGAYVRAPYPYYPQFAFGVNPSPYISPYWRNLMYGLPPYSSYLSNPSDCGSDFPGACPQGFHATTAGCQPCPPYRSIANERFQHLD